MSKTKKLQYYSHEPHCKEEIFDLGIKLWLSKTIHFYFRFHMLFISHIKHTQSKSKIAWGKQNPPHNVEINIKTEIMIGLHRVVQNIFPSIQKGLYQAIPVLWEDCSSFPQ